MIGKHGAVLLSREAAQVLLKELVPRAYLLTPNLPKRRRCRAAGWNHRRDQGRGAVSMRLRSARRAGERRAQCGPHLHRLAAVGWRIHGFSGGSHRDQEYPRDRLHLFGGYRGAARGRAGTSRAVEQAKRFITDAIRANPGLGQGSGPVNHWV